jgi:ZipA, C-terminal FtsZ-binding domain
MSDLQLGLLAIGVAVVAGVIAYNKWQEAKLRRRTEAAFGSRHGDVLLRGGRADGDGDSRPPPATSAPDPVARTIEHTLADDGVIPQPAREPPAGPLPAAMLDPEVDYMVELACARAVAGAEVSAHAQAMVNEALIKPIHWEGYDEARSVWRPFGAEARHLRLRVGLQLANRGGPVAEDDLLAFCGEVQEVALALAAEVDFPDTDTALARAAALDRFCTEVDLQIGLSVIGSESHTFSGSKIRALAESAGLAIGRDGRFHRAGEDGTELFSLANLEPMPFHPETIKSLQTRGVTVLFDVPRVPASAAAFRRFIDFAHQLEQALGGVLVDDNRRPIGQAALEAISQQLERIHQTMAARGIPAGGPLALRLFD